PTHLLLATGGLLIVSGPLRATWHRKSSAPVLPWRLALPMLLSAIYIFSLFTFFTQFAHPLLTTWAAANVRTAPVAGDLYVMNNDGTSQTRLTTDQRGAGEPAWSPDGSRLAFAAMQGTTRQLFVMNADGSHQIQLTQGAGGGQQPAWSPDGRRLAYVAMNDGQARVYVMNADGSDQRRLDSTTADEEQPAWSPDGRSLALAVKRDGTFAIVVVGADGSQPRRLTTTAADLGGLAWSPDGRALAFTSAASGGAQIAVVRADGSGERRLTSGKGENWAPSWSPDGQRIAFASSRDGQAAVYVMNADGGDQRNLTREAGMESGADQLAWSPDGRRIAYSAQGRPVVSAFLDQALGIASILLQTAILMGILLFLIRRFVLPLGALTLVLTVNAVLLSFQHDRFALIPVAVGAGIIADVLFARLRPSAARPGALRVFAFVVPLVYYALYFLALQLSGGIGWTIHLWAGAAIMAGAVGLLLSFLVVPLPLPAEHVITMPAPGVGAAAPAPTTRDGR
ncbi:MAG: PD40 domain-containing protein, partial [Ktedonobacterales bacterium]|nr:PD40 domain-containing protein [Ktedonobacterales bacterium]